jgi:shikimate kinase
MNKPLIYLIGFMGSGKSTIGALLAQKLQWTFIDTDNLIEQHEHRSVAEIFESRGEHYFRTIESRILHDISTQKQAVIATGGGIILRKENRDYMKKTGMQLWLQWNVNNLIHNVMQEPSSRPLFTDEKVFRILYNKRRRWYSMADTAIPCDENSPESIIDAILQYLRISNTI